MASLDISEYIDTLHGNPCEPPVAHQTVVLGEEATESKPFHRQTRCIRIVADTDCRIAIGTNPQAPRALLRAGEKELRIVSPGDGARVWAVAAAPVQASSAASMPIAALLDVITLVVSPSKYKCLVEQIARAQAEADAACVKLGNVKAEKSALAKERAAFDTWAAAEHAGLQEARAVLDGERQQLETDRRGHARNIATLVADRARLEEDRQAHELRLAEFDRMKRLFAA
jgi:hypothetical protein